MTDCGTNPPFSSLDPAADARIVRRGREGNSYYSSADVRAKWTKLVQDASAAPDFKAKLAEIGMEPHYVAPTAADNWLGAERKRWDAVIKKHKIEAN